MKSNDKKLDIISSEMFLKQILSGPYETVGGCRVFIIDREADIKEAARSDKVAVCADIAAFKQNLGSTGAPNVMISQHLLNRTLLTQLAEASSSEKNIIWIND